MFNETIKNEHAYLTALLMKANQPAFVSNYCFEGYHMDIVFLYSDWFIKINNLNGSRTSVYTSVIWNAIFIFFQSLLKVQQYKNNSDHTDYFFFNCNKTRSKLRSLSM